MLRKRFLTRFTFLAGTLFLVATCIEPDSESESSYSEWLSGGSQTIFDKGAGAFSTAFPVMSEAHEAIHETGDVAFEQTFVTAPASRNPGLGPIFNNVSCTSCHINDGRGRPPVGAEAISSMLIRLSIPGTDTNGGPVPVPGYGLQLQQRSVYGKVPEAQVNITYTEKPLAFSDGEIYTLRFPTYALVNPYMPLPADFMLSPRIAPPVFGLGLLQAVAESDILARVDENDANGDGISGKANYVWNVEAGKKTLGRFGWKANNPTVLQQSAGAYNEDMGITSFLFPEENSWDQSQYDGLLDEYEVSDSLLHSVEFYIRTLAVPARRAADDAQVRGGKKIFAAAKCDACHVPRLRTQTDVAFKEVSNQVIYPYTDLLLHDMGDDLADHRPDFDADGREWRTAPLWGIGLTRIVNGHQNFLHDGRARTLIEAIMWHGGEAETSREYVRSLSKSDRDALIRFIESL